MARSETVTANERVKAVSNYAFNLSGALLGVTAARISVATQFDGTSLSWGLVAAALFAVAYGWLHLLEPEDEP